MPGMSSGYKNPVNSSGVFTLPDTVTVTVTVTDNVTDNNGFYSNMQKCSH